MKKKPRKPKMMGVSHLPGDLSKKERLARMIRVDHAGEFGAQRIYAGQLAILGDTPLKEIVREMAAQEDEHLSAFENLIKRKGVRPTVLYPVWHVAGYLLGVATAALGEKAALACTAAVEETIVEHYSRQIDDLKDDETELLKLIKKFRADEKHHQDMGDEHGASQLSYYPLLRALIRSGSKGAIWLSERL